MRKFAKTKLKKTNFSKPQLILFVLFFAAIGGYILIHSFAASNPNLAGDLNNDNTVNALDLSLILSNYNSSNAAGDANSDGIVNALDLSVVLSHYGSTYSPIAVRVNAGGSTYTDGTSNVWSADCCNSGGSAATTANAITGTSDQALYQSQHWNAGSFSYTFSNLSSGSYDVSLKFAEIAFFSPGARQFNVSINGSQVLTNFDISAQAGLFAALDKTFTATPSSGQIVITFSPGAANNPVVNAIQLIPSASGGTGSCPSGVCLPAGDVTSGGHTWHQIFSDDFPATENLALGSYCGDPAGFPHPSSVSGKWSAYPYTWTSTWTKSGTANPIGTWANDCSERVTSIHDGQMDIWLHSDTDPNAGALNELTHNVPLISGSTNSQTNGRYVIRYEEPTSFVGYHPALLIWPDDANHGNLCQGEMDFPEMDTDSTSTSGFVHWANSTSCSQADAYSSPAAAASGWHTFVTEWSPSSVKYYIDGTLIGNDTNTSHIATWNEHWVVQFDACCSTKPAALGSGHILIDWVSIYSY